MAEWEITRPINYSANGDNIGTAKAYEIRIDAATDSFYIRDSDNSKWILLGRMAENFGITPEVISAIRNGGNR